MLKGSAQHLQCSPSFTVEEMEGRLADPVTVGLSFPFSDIRHVGSDGCRAASMERVSARAYIPGCTPKLLSHCKGASVQGCEMPVSCAVPLVRGEVMHILIAYIKAYIASVDADIPVPVLH